MIGRYELDGENKSIRFACEYDTGGAIGVLGFVSYFGFSPYETAIPTCRVISKEVVVQFE